MSRRAARKQRIAEALQTGNADDFTFQLEPSYSVTPNSIQRVGHLSSEFELRRSALRDMSLHAGTLN
jgi:hypothetical protein